MGSAYGFTRGFKQAAHLPGFPIHHPCEFEGKPPGGTTDVQPPSWGAETDRQHALPANPLVKTQHVVWDEIKRTDISDPSVVKQEVLVEVLSAFVRIDPHRATCLTNSVGW